MNLSTTNSYVATARISAVAERPCSTQYHLNR